MPDVALDGVLVAWRVLGRGGTEGFYGGDAAGLQLEGAFTRERLAPVLFVGTTLVQAGEGNWAGLFDAGLMLRWIPQLGAAWAPSFKLGPGGALVEGRPGLSARAAIGAIESNRLVVAARPDDDHVRLRRSDARLRQRAERERFANEQVTPPDVARGSVTRREHHEEVPPVSKRRGLRVFARRG